MDKNRYIYKITNLTPTIEYPQKYYIGKRTTSKKPSEDEYWGSSNYLTTAIGIIGKENFKKEILSIHDNEVDLRYTERKLLKAADVEFNLDYFNIYSNYNFDIDDIILFLDNELPYSIVGVQADKLSKRIYNDEIDMVHVKKFHKNIFTVFDIDSCKLISVLEYSNKKHQQYNSKKHIITRKLLALNLQTGKGERVWDYKIKECHSLTIPTHILTHVKINSKLFVLFDKCGKCIYKDWSNIPSFIHNSGLTVSTIKPNSLLMKTKTKHPDHLKIIIEIPFEFNLYFNTITPETTIFELINHTGIVVNTKFINGDYIIEIEKEKRIQQSKRTCHLNNIFNDGKYVLLKNNKLMAKAEYYNNTVYDVMESSVYYGKKTINI